MGARNWLLGLIVLAVAGVGVAYWKSQSTSEGLRKGATAPEQFSARKPKPAPAIELKDSKGDSRKLSELKGNLVLVHFWASWCAPCVPEFPEILAFADRYKDQKVKVVAVSIDDNWEGAAKMLPEKLPENTWVLWDKDAKTPDSYGTYQYPETYLLDGDLQIIYKWVGPQDWKGPAVEHLMENALKLLEPRDASG